jgi:hypothetical protein
MQIRSIRIGFRSNFLEFFNILLGLFGENRGRVYFKDHDTGSVEGSRSKFEDLPLIAISFESFIESLYVKPEDSQ